MRNRLVGKKVTLLGLVCMLIVLCMLAVHAETLNMEESINIALNNNPGIHIANENIKKADIQIKEAESAGKPRVGLGATYQRLDKATTVDFGGQKIPMNKADNVSANLNVGYMVDVFGTTKSARTAASEGRKAYENSFNQTVNDTVLNVKTAYFNVLRAQKYQNVSQETLNQLKAHLKDAQLHFEAGNIAKYDVLRAETQVANAEQMLISSSNAVSMAKAAFNTVLGRSVEMEFELEEIDSEKYVSVNLNDCLEAAKKNRPEILSIESMSKVNDELVKIAKNSAKPSFNLQWVGTHNFDTSVLNSRENSWVAVLSASFSIFDGGYNKSQIDKAESDANTTKLTKDQVVLGISLEAQQAYLSLIESEERVKAADKAVVQAEEAYRLAVLRYQNGVSIQLEVLDTETALTSAKTNKVNAVYDYQTAFAKLEKAVGGREVFASIVKS